MSRLSLQTSTWEAVIAMLEDLQQAIDLAQARGDLTPFGTVILYQHYVWGWTFEQIGGHFDIHESTIRREHRKALQAIKNTGMLDGYD